MPDRPKSFFVPDPNKTVLGGGGDSESSKVKDSASDNELKTLRQKSKSSKQSGGGAFGKK